MILIELQMSKNKNKYCVYVIALKKEVLKEKKFTIMNPQYQQGKKCYYVGSTSLTPEERLRIHVEAIPTKKGTKQFNKYVNRYSDGLRPGQYKSLGFFDSRKEAMLKEKAKAKRLRSKGHAIWTDGKFMEEFMAEENQSSSS